MGRRLSRQVWVESGRFMKYAPPMNPTMKRILIVVSVIWFAIWAYVGWRGYSLMTDAYSSIDQMPPGSDMPPEVLAVLKAGQSYTLNAVIWGAAIPLCPLVILWIVGPSFKRRSQSGH
jgi:hypothetical protein